MVINIWFISLSSHHIFTCQVLLFLSPKCTVFPENLNATSWWRFLLSPASKSRKYPSCYPMHFTSLFSNSLAINLYHLLRKNSLPAPECLSTHPLPIWLLTQAYLPLGGFFFLLPVVLTLALSLPASLNESESEVAQSCPTLCDPVDCSPPGSYIHGILQARILEWVAISFSRGSSRPGIEPRSPALQADALTSEPRWYLTNEYTWK